MFLNVFKISNQLPFDIIEIESKYFQAGLDSIYEITKNNLKDEENESDKDENNNKKDKLEKKLSQTGLKQTESLLSLRNLTRGRILSDTDDLSKQNHGKVLKDEVKVFINIITETTFESTKKFWLKYKTSMPNLFNLACKLLSIPATSAFIERFFSLTGQINKQQSNSVSVDLLRTRSMLKAHMKLIDIEKY